MNRQTCAKHCEARAYQIEIRRLKSILIHEAAELARLLHHEDITDHLDRTLYAQIQRMKSAGLDGGIKKEPRRSGVRGSHTGACEGLNAGE